MRKELIVIQIISKLEADLALLLRAAHEAKEAATHSESRQEGKYDTRGLEASYLAGAQAKRASELQELIPKYQNLSLISFSTGEEIRATALVEILSDEKKSWIFLVPLTGGFVLNSNDRKIQVVACKSPLGQALLGREVGDIFEFELLGQKREIEILGLS